MYRFTYNDQGFASTLTAAGGYFNSRDFALNSPFDPDITGFGIQPVGWDQVMGAGGSNMFSFYRVFASKITLYVYDVSGDTKSPSVRVVLTPRAGAMLGGISPIEAGLAPGSRSNVVRTSDQTDSMKLRSYYKVKSLIPLGQTANDLRAAYNANPNLLCYWHVDFDGATSCTEDTTVRYEVKITYLCKCWKTDPLNSS